MNNRGFYRLHRGWMDNSALGGARDPYCRRAAWVWLVENAAWKDTCINVQGNTIAVGRGQISVSYRTLATVWKWGLKAVRVFIDRLERDTMIGTDAGTGRMLITICNYDHYQSVGRGEGTEEGTPRGTPRAQEGHRRGTQKNESNENNELRKIRTFGSFDQTEPVKPSNSDLFPGADVVPIRTDGSNFEEWWGRYPRKVGKEAARKAFGKALKAGASAGELIRGLQIQRWTSEPQFVPHPATWLNQGRWKDDPEAAAPAAAPKASPYDWMVDPNRYNPFAADAEQPNQSDPRDAPDVIEPFLNTYSASKA